MESGTLFDKDTASLSFFCSKSQNRTHDFNIFSVRHGFFSNTSRQDFYVGANPRVSKTPVFSNPVFFTLSDISWTDIRYSYEFFWLHIFRKNILTPKALRFLFLIYVQL